MISKKPHILTCFKATDHCPACLTKTENAQTGGIELQETAHLIKPKLADGNDEAQKKEFERKQLDVELQVLMRFKGNLDKVLAVFIPMWHSLLTLAILNLKTSRHFTKLLSKRLNGMSTKEIDISGLVLTGFGIFKKKLKTRVIKIILKRMNLNH